MAVYKDFGGAAVDAEEGIHIANALGPEKKTLILQNHGYAVYETFGNCKLYDTDKSSLES